MTADPVTRAAERDLADTRAGYSDHQDSAECDGMFCLLCTAYRDAIRRCELQVTLLAGDGAELEQPDLFGDEDFPATGGGKRGDHPMTQEQETEATAEEETGAEAETAEEETEAGDAEAAE